MEADWYIDPLGRFEGRFFDGEAWTDQVSDRGLLAADPEWPSATGRSVAEADVDLHLGEVQIEVAEVQLESQDPTAAGQMVFETTALQTASFGEDKFAPAVEPAAPKIQQGASLVPESPARAVVVLDEIEAATTEDPKRRWLMYALGTAALMAGLALLLVPGWFDDDGPDNQQDTVAAPESSGATADESNPSSGDSDVQQPLELTGDELQVGGLTIVDGTSVLTALADWHQGYATDRGIVLGSDAGCWFASLGDAAVENVYCGPVAGNADTEFVYDVVPVAFAEVGPDQVSAAAVIDAAIPDSFVPNGLDLVGPGGSFDPPVQSPATRGLRAPAND